MKLCYGCMTRIESHFEICPNCGYCESEEEIRDEHLLPGTMINDGRYIIGKAIGHGGFGVTYVGYDNLMDKKVAIKEYLPGEFSTRNSHQTHIKIYSGDKSEQFTLGMSKFVDEAKKLAMLNFEDGVVNVFDSFEENGTAYIVMKYLEGETLQTRLERKGKLSLAETEELILPIFEALRNIHNTGIIHRDIAPDNIFITADGEEKGRAKLLDFGAARFATATHSRSLTVIYKSGYSPEEQYEGKGNQGPWTDVYALAATFYKCITGVTPDNSLERRAKDTLKKPSSLGVSISKNKETALLNALNVDPENRTKTAAQFLTEYNSTGKVKRVMEKFAGFDIGKLSKKTKAVIITAIAVVALAAVGLIFLLSDRSRISDRLEVAEGQTRVPNFVNESVSSAQEMAAEAGIYLVQKNVIYDSTIPEGKILSQSEEPASFVEQGSLVSYVVSAGKERVHIPANIAGMQKNDVLDQLRKAGVNCVATEVVFSDTITVGNVVGVRLKDSSEILKNEAVVDDGAEIVLVISKGIDETKDVQLVEYVVENFVGMDIDEVRAIIDGYEGIYIDISEQIYTGEDNEGLILDQKTAKGTLLSSKDMDNNTVYLVVSKGIQYGWFPARAHEGVQYDDDLKDELAKEGFIVVKEERGFNEDLMDGCVIAFFAEDGTEIEAGQKLPAGEISVLINDRSIATVKKTPTPKPKATKTPTPKPKATKTPTPKPKATKTPTPKPVSKLPVKDGLNIIPNSSDRDESTAYVGAKEGSIQEDIFGVNAFRVAPEYNGLKITKIGTAAFSGWVNIVEIELPDTVSEIGEKAFLNCYDLEKITLPSGITEIKNETFADCRKLKTITIPKGVTSIGTKAFYHCYALTKITVPDGVTHIGREVFDGCTSLKTIEFPKTIEEIDGSLFFNCPELESIYVYKDSYIEQYLRRNGYKDDKTVIKYRK